jgi:shikimate dehydrogenase
MATRAPAACVIGWPIEHSRSPLIHNYWIKQHGLAGEYRREAVAPPDFPAFVQDLAQRGYAGANVTIPHKEAALALSIPDDRALAVGSANTLWLDGGQLKSTNTDVEGFLANLDATSFGWDRAEEALVLGAGGAARAVVFGLIERGFERIYVANRTLERAEALREKFGDKVIPGRWDQLPALVPRVGLLVNTTSLGMLGQPPLDVDISMLRDDAVVSDLVYVPLATSLLQSAQSRGLRTADGLGMLLHQAVRGFSLWFGVRPQVTAELRLLIEADLAKS